MGPHHPSKAIYSGITEGTAQEGVTAFPSDPGQGLEAAVNAAKDDEGNAVTANGLAAFNLGTGVGIAITQEEHWPRVSMLKFKQMSWNLLFRVGQLGIAKGAAICATNAARDYKLLNFGGVANNAILFESRGDVSNGKIFPLVRAAVTEDLDEAGIRAKLKEAVNVARVVNDLTALE